MSLIRIPVLVIYPGVRVSALNEVRMTGGVPSRSVVMITEHVLRESNKSYCCSGEPGEPGEARAGPHYPGNEATGSPGQHQGGPSWGRPEGSGPH